MTCDYHKDFMFGGPFECKSCWPPEAFVIGRSAVASYDLAAPGTHSQSVSMAVKDPTTPHSAMQNVHVDDKVDILWGNSNSCSGRVLSFDSTSFVMKIARISTPAGNIHTAPDPAGVYRVLFFDGVPNISDADDLEIGTASVHIQSSPGYRATLQVAHLRMAKMQNQIPGVNGAPTKKLTTTFVSTTIAGTEVKTGDSVNVSTDNGQVTWRYFGVLKAVDLDTIDVETTHGAVTISICDIRKLSVTSTQNQIAPPFKRPCVSEVDIGGVKVRLGDSVEVHTGSGMIKGHYVGVVVEIDEGDISVKATHGVDYIPILRIDKIIVTSPAKGSGFAKGGVVNNVFDLGTPPQDSVAGLTSCDYCNGRGEYEPFTGPTQECPKCNGTGNV